MVDEFDELKNNMQSKMISIEFAQACAAGSLEHVKDLYTNYYIKKINFKHKVLKFLKLSENIILNPHINNELPFFTACIQGHTEVINFLLNDKNFFKNFNQETMSRAYLTLFNFGHDNVIKSLIEKLKLNHYVAFNDNDLPLMQHFFIQACKLEKIDILKSFSNKTVLKTYLETNPIKEYIKITNEDIINYLLFDLELGKNDKFIENIDSQLFHSLLDKKENYQDLQKEIGLSNNPTVLTKNKKPKI